MILLLKKKKKLALVWNCRLHAELISQKQMESVPIWPSARKERRLFTQDLHTVYTLLAVA